jgi:hypothetical protein
LAKEILKPKQASLFTLLAKFDERFQFYFKGVRHTGEAVFSVIFIGFMIIGAVVGKLAGFYE